MNTARSVTGIGVAVAFGAIVVSAGSAGGATRAGIPVFAWCALIAFGLQWLAFLPAWLAHSERFFDLTGSVTYLTVVLVALVASPEPGSRALLLGAMVVVWATRLGSFLFARVHAMGSDSRFDDMKHRFAWFLMTWTLQGLWVILTAAAALAAITAVDQPNLGPLDAVGLLVWASGLVFEVVADQQKRRFRSAAQNQGRFIYRPLGEIASSQLSGRDRVVGGRCPGRRTCTLGLEPLDAGFAGVRVLSTHARQRPATSGGSR